MIIDDHLHVTQSCTTTRKNGSTYATPPRLIEMMDEQGIDAGILPATAHLREAVSTEINILREPVKTTPGTCLILNLEPSGYAAALVARGPGE